jgi:hypothetical protein
VKVAAVPAAIEPTRMPVGTSAEIRSPMASTLSPPGASPRRPASAPRRTVVMAPVLTESGTATLSMRAGSASSGSTVAKSAVLSIVGGSR